MATFYNSRAVTDGLILSLDAANRKSFSGEPATNIINYSSVGAERYNNPGFSGNIITTNMTFKGAPVYQATFVPQTDALVNTLGAGDGFGLWHSMGANLSASTHYIASVYFRTDHPLINDGAQGFNNTYSNISGWGVGGTTSTRYVEDGWTRLYTIYYRSTNGYVDRFNSIATNHVVNTTQTTTIVVSQSVSSGFISNFSTLYALVEHNPTIRSNGGLVGLSILNHGLDTGSWTKLSFPSNIRSGSQLPYTYYVQLSVPSTAGNNTTIQLGYNANGYYTSVSDDKYWKITFNNAGVKVNQAIKTYWAAPMIEQKSGSLPSEFVIGTRGTTVATGGGWADLSGNNNHAELRNRPTVNAMPFSEIVFDGSSSYAGISSPSDRFAWTPSGAGLNNMTIEMWIKTADNSGQYFSKPWNGNGEYNYQWGGTSVNLQIGNQSTSISTPSITDNRWKHFVYWINATQHGYYLNGNESIGSQNHGITNNTPSFGNSQLPLTLMTLYPYTNDGGWSQTSFSIAGSVAMFKVYNRVLSATEVLQNFNSNRSRFGV